VAAIGADGADPGLPSGLATREGRHRNTPMTPLVEDVSLRERVSQRAGRTRYRARGDDVGQVRCLPFLRWRGFSVSAFSWAAWATIVALVAVCPFFLITQVQRHRDQADQIAKRSDLQKSEGSDMAHESSTLSTNMTSIQPELWVEAPSKALAFYEAAFGAKVLHLVGDGDDIVAQIGIGEAAFWIAPVSRSMKRLSPRDVDGATGRTLLVVDDPDSVLNMAVAAGASESSAVQDEHGWRLGRIIDPFGHEWEIGVPNGEWPPA
jgi:PhnB protein